ncbi:hypothetical protein [Burkholderia ubonensis]|uniref:hypothetical protein n=1 Tax=Burkholderia ubonensis TaxID=101571 RepID=UPI001177550E|nr:hypothetical protein [Burkholderia ubonensis]
MGTTMNVKISSPIRDTLAEVRDFIDTYPDDEPFGMEPPGIDAEIARLRADNERLSAQIYALSHVTPCPPRRVGG